MGKREDIIWLTPREETFADFELRNRTLIIHLKEDLDHHNAIWIREQADKILEQRNALNIIFDFKKVSFMDSSGIGVIMGRYKRVIFIGGKVAVVGVSDSVNRILMLSGLYKIMAHYKDIEEAMASM
ncbi:anti-sigma F factor antagonist [Clostridium sp. Marseille-P299]|uniref:anti-sigma F factor antagonist n=1 Tax=Clostridium sp. Marseille-P299 TaxID=1805477 RepID=UPI000836DDFC|nr:anti-sigma F factor antagonist [Clostridium sp. Marseille-P299]